MSTVAIVMATYNGEKYVGQQINSILASTYQDFELFIYDDGSKDDTVSILREYEKVNSDKVHVFQNERNRGVNLNFLMAMGRTTMDYIMFCDQDDVWKPNKIAITLKRIRHMEAQFGKEMPLAVFTDASIVDKDLKEIHSSFFNSNHLDPRKTDLAHLLMENKLIGCTVMVNASLRKILQSNNYPEKSKLHDWWIALIAASFGRIGYVNESTLLYRQHENNVVGGAAFGSYVKKRIATLNRQREAIRVLQRQAEEFLLLYEDLLTEEKSAIILKFANLDQVNFMKRRSLILKHGYLKTGLVRNIGLLIII